MKTILKAFLATVASCRGALLLIMVISLVPCHSREAMGDQIKICCMPLVEKLTRFYLRHLDLERMAAEATQGEADPQRRVLKLLEWTRKVVRPNPPGFLVVDDHISYVVLRRYGAEYQLAEVFTTLAFYVGHEARWDWYTPPGADVAVALSFVRSERGWWVFDVRNGGWFETDTGEVATIEDFQHPDSLHRRSAAPDELGGTPYVNYFQNLDSVWNRSFSRARGQSPWHRFLIETGLEPA